MRYQLGDLQQFPDFGLRIGAFLAELLFFTSDLYLDARTKRQWEQFFVAQQAKELLLDVLFQEGCVLFDTNKKFEKAARETHRRIAANQKLKLMVFDLGRRFYEGKQCFCHTDLHAGNIMITPGEIRLIDCEYGGYSAFFQDIGRIAGSFIVNYVSWLGMPEVAYTSRLKMQQYDLDMIRDLFNGCLEMLKRLFVKYGPKRPALKRMNPEAYFMSFFYDSIRCAALVAACRTPTDWTQPYEIARIKRPDDLGLVQKRALEIAEYTLERNFTQSEIFAISFNAVPVLVHNSFHVFNLMRRFAILHSNHIAKGVCRQYNKQVQQTSQSLPQILKQAGPGLPPKIPSGLNSLQSRQIVQTVL